MPVSFYLVDSNHKYMLRYTHVFCQKQKCQGRQELSFHYIMNESGSIEEGGKSKVGEQN